MARVLFGRNGKKLGAYLLPERKHPALCVADGNSLVVYGYFRDKTAAMEFMHELALAIGAQEDPTEEE